MSKIALLVIILLLVFAMTPAATSVKDFVQANSHNSLDIEENFLEENMDDLDFEEPKEASPTPTGTVTSQTHETISKQDGNVRYEGTIDRTESSTSAKTTENGTTTVTNKNVLSSSTNIDVSSDTGGNSGQNVSNGNSEVSIKVKTDGKETKIDMP